MDCIRRERSYWTLCRCPSCIIDTARKRKLQSLGYRRAVTHQQAWAVLSDRFANGWTALAVASATGLDGDYFSRHLARWRQGQQCHIGPAAAELIVTMGRPTQGQVGAEPTRRRLRALAAIGYGLDTLATQTGVNFSTLAAIRNTNDKVGARIANAVADAYPRLHMTPGNDPQASRIAREKGWLSPMAYDDIETGRQPTTEAHDPSAVDHAVVERILAGDYRLTCTVAEKTAVCARWMALGRPLNELDRHTGWQTRRYTKGAAA